jgi:hypothetical protein
MKRRILRRVSVVALAAWMAAVFGPALISHSQAIDTVCSDEGWRAPRPGAHIQNVHPGTGGGHCPLCHLQRVAREAFAEGPRMASPQTIAAAPAATGSPCALFACAELLPARAPPSLL